MDQYIEIHTMPFSLDLFILTIFYIGLSIIRLQKIPLQAVLSFKSKLKGTKFPYKSLELQEVLLFYHGQEL